MLSFAALFVMYVLAGLPAYRMGYRRGYEYNKAAYSCQKHHDNHMAGLGMGALSWVVWPILMPWWLVTEYLTPVTKERRIELAQEAFRKWEADIAAFDAETDRRLAALEKKSFKAEAQIPYVTELPQPELTMQEQRDKHSWYIVLGDKEHAVRWVENAPNSNYGEWVYKKDRWGWQELHPRHHKSIKMRG